jgi:hypothetical protein
MAGKPRNRLELRKQHEAAEPIDPMEMDFEEPVEELEDSDETERKPKKKAKAPAAKKPKAAKAPKTAARMRIVWAVVSDSFKTVATFDYTQKEAAEAKAAEMTARGKGTHFVQKMKEPMPEGAPGLGASMPRPAAPETKSKSKSKAQAVKVEEFEIEDEEIEEEPEDEEEDMGDDDE